MITDHYHDRGYMALRSAYTSDNREMATRELQIAKQLLMKYGIETPFWVKAIYRVVLTN